MPLVSVTPLFELREDGPRLKAHIWPSDYHVIFGDQTEPGEGVGQWGSGSGRLDISVQQTVTFLDHGPFTNVEVPEDCAFIGQPAVASYNTCIALPKIRASFTNYALWMWKWNWPVGAQREDAYREPACLGKHFEVDEHLTKFCAELIKDGKSIQKIRESFDPFFRDAKSKAKTQWESAAQEFKKIIIQGHLRLMNSEMKAGWDALGSDKRNEWDKKAENLKASEEFDLSMEATKLATLDFIYYISDSKENLKTGW
ncbi:hypothetical protein BJ912DRAFT_930706 [Pholiota molesta]|nr:hypothetical protein BJ912DRAFT_930706 [Pholiota molesta]